jgi:hypothetical protein
MKKTLYFLLVLVLLALALFLYKGVKAPTGSESLLVGGYKDAVYKIDGQLVKLTDGVSEMEAAPGSASKTVTKYFGNEIKTDLNGDGVEDVAFILTQNSGGSGTFYYAVAAIKTNEGYLGSDGYPLGDRIAPQSTNLSPNLKQKYVVVFNYAVRKSGEPMTASPSVGKSAYLKVDPKTMQWGVVQPNFEGESK